MKTAASTLVSILIAVAAIWLLMKLLGLALKLVAILIGVALAVWAYYFVQRLMRGPDNA